MAQPAYQRVLLKLSGEAFMGTVQYGIEPGELNRFASELCDALNLGVQIAVVVGGGNIWRGQSPLAQGMDRATADNMGMLATVINGLALQDALEKTGAVTRLQTAIAMHEVAEPYIRRRAIRHLEKGRIVILAAGTGSPYFTTDTAAALRAVEIGADVLLKATKVEGVYSADPVTNPNARFYRRLTYLDSISQGLKVMDGTAVTLCMENSLPIIVFNLTQPGNIVRAIRGEQIGTTICADPLSAEVKF